MFCRCSPWLPATSREGNDPGESCETSGKGGGGLGTSRARGLGGGWVVGRFNKGKKIIIYTYICVYIYILNIMSRLENYQRLCRFWTPKNGNILNVLQLPMTFRMVWIIEAMEPQFKSEEVCKWATMSSSFTIGPHRTASIIDNH